MVLNRYTITLLLAAGIGGSSPATAWGDSRLYHSKSAKSTDDQKIPRLLLVNQSRLNEEEKGVQVQAEAGVQDKDWKRIWAMAQTNFAEAVGMITFLALPAEAKTYLKAKLVVELCRDELGDLPTYLKQTGDLAAREMAVGLVASVWQQKDPETLMHFAMAYLDDADLNIASSYGIQGLINLKQFATASEILAKLPVSNRRTGLFYNLALSYVLNDFDAALAWVETIPPGADQNKAYEALLPTIAKRRGVVGLEKVADKVEDKEVRKACVEWAVETFAEKGDLDEATRWVRALAADVKVAAQLRLVKVAAERELEHWTQYVMQEIPPNARPQAIADMCQRVFNNDRGAASRWAISLPNSVRQSAVRTIVWLWNDPDPVATVAWVNSLESGLAKDEALSELAYSVAQKNVTVGEQIARQIGNPKRRDSILKALVEHQRMNTPPK